MRWGSALLLASLFLASPSAVQASAGEETPVTKSIAPAGADNWARSATGFGFFFTVFIQPTGFASDGLRMMVNPGPGGRIVPAWGYLMPWVLVPSVLVMLVSPPIIAVGSASARKDPRVRGFPGVRTAGWILYFAAATMSIPLTTIALHPWFCEGCRTPDLPVGLITIMTVIGALSGMLFTIDGMGSLRHLEALQDGMTPEEIPTMRAAPFLAPISGGAVVGLGGTF